MQRISDCSPFGTDRFFSDVMVHEGHWSRSWTIHCRLVLGWCIGCIFGMAEPAFATQTHDAPEGLYVHQMAHIFFVFSMGILIYWLRGRNLVRESGWRFIQYSASCFILWNLGAFFSHFLEERKAFFQMVHAGFWHSRISFSEESTMDALFFYVTKMDHLVLLPAIIFLYTGLRQLLKQAQEAEHQDDAL